MHLKKSLLIGVLTVPMATACMSKKQTVMSDMATLNAEEHAMWSRPLEMGYEVIGDVQGEATMTKVLGFGSAGGSGITSMFGANQSSDKGFNAVVANAAYNAVLEAGADAIYVTRHEVEKTGFLMFYTRRDAKVFGKALRLVDYGTVDINRSDDYRMGRNNTLIIDGRDGGEIIPVPEGP
jgi:hypothetical protein